MFFFVEQKKQTENYNQSTNQCFARKYIYTIYQCPMMKSIKLAIILYKYVKYLYNINIDSGVGAW